MLAPFVLTLLLFLDFWLLSDAPDLTGVFCTSCPLAGNYSAEIPSVRLYRCGQICSLDHRFSHRWISALNIIIMSNNKYFLYRRNGWEACVSSPNCLPKSTTTITNFIIETIAILLLDNYTSQRSLSNPHSEHYITFYYCIDIFKANFTQNR